MMIDNFKSKTDFSLITSTSLIVIIGIVCISLFGTMMYEVYLKSKNIQTAIEKGIDPMTVRCSYASSDDRICLAYAIGHKSIDAPELRRK